jgi:hypothetical protein
MNAILKRIEKLEIILSPEGDYPTIYFDVVDGRKDGHEEPTAIMAVVPGTTKKHGFLISSEAGESPEEFKVRVENERMKRMV